MITVADNWQKSKCPGEGLQSLKALLLNLICVRNINLFICKLVKLKENWYTYFFLQNYLLKKKKFLNEVC